MYTITVPHTQHNEAVARDLVATLKPVTVTETPERISVGTPSAITYLVICDSLEDDSCPAS